MSQDKELPTAEVWNSIFIVTGKDMDFDLVSSLLNMQPTVALRKDEFSVPTVSDGVPRHFDVRLARDNWRKFLTGNQSKQPIEVQFSYWINLLHPVRTALDRLTKLGYWCVIDCTGYRPKPGLGVAQFRLSPETRLKLAKIPVDIDFTIW